MKKELLLLMLLLSGSIVGFSKIIKFADANVKQICVQNWDTNGDGELSTDEAAAVTELGNVFQRKTKIVSFTELQYFTGLTSIGGDGYDAGSFYGCASLEKITIPENIEIVHDAFNGCDALSEVRVNAKNLAEYYQPYSIRLDNSIANLSYFHTLEEVIIGSKVQVLPHSLFGGVNNVVFEDRTSDSELLIHGSWICYLDSGFSSLDYPIGKLTFDVDYQSFKESQQIRILGEIVKIEGTFDEWPLVGTVRLSSSITELNAGTFSGCNKLSSVVFSQNLKTIGKGAFEGCNSLSKLEFPESLETIGESAFEGCIGLTGALTFPKGAVLSDRSFYGCTGITSVSIPKNQKTLPSYVFAECTNLSSVTLPEGLTGIYEGAFKNCSKLTSVAIPNTVVSIIGGFWGTGLTSVVIPNSVKRLQGWAFAYCNNLKSVTIGSGIEKIGGYGESLPQYKRGVFAGSDNIKVIRSLISEPPYYSENNDGEGQYRYFTGSVYSNATLYVPAGAKEVYQGTGGWKKFTNIVEDVKVKLNKTKSTIEKGKTLTLKATLTPSSLSDKTVTWKSSNTSVATVTSSGKVKGVKAGTTTITCTYVATGAKATCKVTVGYVSLDKSEVIVKKGKTVTLTPTVYPSSLTDKSVTWASSDTKIATVTSEGKVKGVKYGTATITCTSNATGLSTTCAVMVGNVVLGESSVAIQKGKTKTLKATVYPSSLEDKSVTWKSSDESVATVSSTGKVKGVKYGTATITCTSNATGLSATCKVTVGKVIISMSEFTLKKSRTTVLTATVYPSSLTDKSVTWESSNTAVATITADGKVKGVKAGTATITCTSVATGLSGTCTVTVLSTSGTRSSEGDDDGTTGIEMMEDKSAVAEPYDVYDLSGRMVRHQVTSLEGLPNGIYIVNGKKILKK